MSVIVEFSIPAADFVLGRALQQTSGLSIELERVVPTGDVVAPYVWVNGEGHDAFDAVLTDSTEVESFAVVDEIEGQHLYRVEWRASADTLLQTITAYDVVLQEVHGDDERWVFQLRFPDSHTLAEFHTECRESGIDLSMDRLFNPIQPSGTATKDLTQPQRRVIQHAYAEGYFDVPRQTTLVDIAGDLGVSDQSVNERMRRGLRRLIQSTVDPTASRDE